MMVEVGVTNPVVGLTTVAIAPFFNLSQERACDGRRFAMAYYTELQKTPGFQVIPIGVVEQAMYDNRLEMNNPDDVLRLAQLLNADAVVVGAVTDYSPYYPPRIGMQVSWYSPRPWQFYPGIPVDELAREGVLPHSDRWKLIKPKATDCENLPPGAVMVSPPQTVTTRGQSPDDLINRAKTVSLPEFLLFGENGAPRQVSVQQQAESDMSPRELGLPELPSPGQSPGPSSGPSYNRATEEPPIIGPGAPLAMPPGQLMIQRNLPFDCRQPLMSYTRMFDGADAKLTARLRDYVELSGDLRSGGWESYMYRSEDFIRFTSHVMIVEMLQLHGGEARKRVVFKFRKYR